MEIRVGIATDGEPDIEEIAPGRNRLRNQLIGKDFHWQRPLSTILPGRVEILPVAGADGIRLVNILPMEHYLEMVVGSEMNPAAPPEFLKCHAILSRSWAAGKILRSHPEGGNGKIDRENIHIGWDDTADHQGFHVCADDHCQRYQGEIPISEAGREAIRSTRGLILADPHGMPIDARFSKCCGGKTEFFSSCWQDEEPYGLTSVDDPWCDLSSLPVQERDRLLSTILKEYDSATTAADYFRWEERIEKSLLESRLHECFGIDLFDKTGDSGHKEKRHAYIRVTPIERGISGRLIRIKIQGGHSVEIGKELHIRRILSETHLKSSLIDITDEGESLLLHGRGWGHGVGLCQIGAAHMALTHTCEEILRHYFPGVKIERLSIKNHNR